MHSHAELAEMEAREKQQKEKERVDAVKRKLQFEQTQREEEEMKKEKNKKMKGRQGSKLHQGNVMWRWLACFHQAVSQLIRKVGYIYVYINMYITEPTAPLI